ncbi:MAG: glycoside hydrolase [Undibacterium sp.]|nr:glycoside hydrolase [Opitutaceae bacterium]
MPAPRPVLAFLAVFALTCFSRISAAENSTSTDSAWPEITRENKPWTRWWWPGSAVDKASLTRQLEQFAAAGLGGVEITPIYGAKGYEDRYIDYLSPKWMEMLEHTAREARRLGLGVDMATGTGWPFGGPWIPPADANTKAVLNSTGKLVGEPTRQLVKRPGPGGEGLVLDPYSPDALGRYLAKFDEAFTAAQLPRGLIRGQFHDSFEYYGATWTAKLPEVFRAMHGYDIQTYAAALLAKPGDPALAPLSPDTLGRVKSDYRETLARLHLDYLRAWVTWSHDHGFIVRNQSHGAPGNLLDLYANADIAETEIFGSTPFPIPGLRRDPADIANNAQDLPESLVVRMASSAAHVAGHALASSETATWLRDHWKESLAFAKPEIDRIFADGINHVFYHGSVFSPNDAPWPGWLFYASTQFQPHNPWWDDFGALNRYVARVQSILQRGQPDNDILLYWPFADLLDDEAGAVKMFTVHNVKWLPDQPVGKIARALMDRGYTFDYISDAQLQQTRSESGALLTGGSNRYQIIVVPATRRMPVATLQKLAALAASGAKIIFEKLPDDVPGYGRLAERRAEFKTALAALSPHAAVNSDVLAAVAPHARREALADAGLNFIRRTSTSGTHDYFVTNLTARPFAGWIKLGATAQSVLILNPLDGHHGLAAQSAQGMFLQIAPGESLLLRTSNAPSRSPAWPYRRPAAAAVPLTGTWKISFLQGGPELPPALETTELKSWTDFGGDETKRFAGTARYRLEFDAPIATADDWLLDLGDVRESARVILNGQPIATAWSLPFRVRIASALLKPGRNLLELDVTNLAANRIRDMDQRKLPWKIMRDANVLNINYKPFDASGWPLTPSGLLGPVTVTPLKAFTP